MKGFGKMILGLLKLEFYCRLW